MNKILTIPIFAFTPMLAHAADILPVKQIGPELATEVALKAVEERLEFAD